MHIHILCITFKVILLFVCLFIGSELLNLPEQLLCLLVHYFIN